MALKMTAKDSKCAITVFYHNILVIMALKMTAKDSKCASNVFYQNVLVVQQQEYSLAEQCIRCHFNPVGFTTLIQC